MSESFLDSVGGICAASFLVNRATMPDNSGSRKTISQGTVFGNGRLQNDLVSVGLAHELTALVTHTEEEFGPALEAMELQAKKQTLVGSGLR